MRITAELRRRGMLVNHKRVSRLMRADNLLAMQPRAFVVTTDSKHQFEVYLNLASRMKLTRINQLWVADITYIRLDRAWYCKHDDEDKIDQSAQPCPRPRPAIAQ